MKGRFCSLRHGVRTHSIEMCDKLWLTCYALHNRLLFVDGLHQNWNVGTKSHWEKEFSSYAKRNSVDNFAYQRLFSNVESDRNNLVEESRPTRCFKKHTVDGKRILRKMPLKLFQERLVEHFDIRFKVKKDVVWPSQMKIPSVI